MVHDVALKPLDLPAAQMEHESAFAVLEKVPAMQPTQVIRDTPPFFLGAMMARKVPAMQGGVGAGVG